MSGAQNAATCGASTGSTWPTTRNGNLQGALDGPHAMRYGVVVVNQGAGDVPWLASRQIHTLTTTREQSACRSQLHSIEWESKAMHNETAARRNGRENGAEENREFAELGNPEEFPDDYVSEERQRHYLPDADTSRRGARAGTVEAVLASACGGWKREPTSAEFHEAVQAEQPTRRQLLIVATLAVESTWVELVKAHLEGAFTWRQLVRGLQGRGWCPRKRARQINVLRQRKPMAGRG